MPTKRFIHHNLLPEFSRPWGKSPQAHKQNIRAGRVPGAQLLSVVPRPAAPVPPSPGSPGEVPGLRPHPTAELESAPAQDPQGLLKPEQHFSGIN